MLQNGLPMEQFQLPFKEALARARNAEEALLVALNSCARATKKISAIVHTDPTVFGAWFRRIQGQRTGPQSVLAASCLSFLDLSEAFLDVCDFYGADFQYSRLIGVQAHFATLCHANLSSADMRHSVFVSANMNGAYLDNADLSAAQLLYADIRTANLTRANLKNADLRSANLENAILDHANLEDANFEDAILQNASLENASVEKAKFDGARGLSSQKSMKRR